MLEKIRYSNFGTKDFDLGDMELEFNRLNIFTGKNGSGKTLVFKTVWFVSNALNIYKAMSMAGVPKLDEIFEEEVNRLFRLTFHEHEKLDGAMQISDKKDEIFVFTLAFNGGTLEHFQLDIRDMKRFEVGSIQSVKYNSKEARTFEAYNRYIKTKKMLGIDTLQSNDDFEKLGEWYRVYDMMWFEEMYQTILHYEENPEAIEAYYTLLSQLGSKELVEEVSPFREGHKLVAKEGVLYDRNPDGNLKDLATLSSGEQAILMMLLFNKPGGNQ
jgi:predicted ATP-binding protein involved in virulence